MHSPFAIMTGGCPMYPGPNLASPCLWPQTSRHMHTRVPLEYMNTCMCEFLPSLFKSNPSMREPRYVPPRQRHVDLVDEVCA